MDRPLDTNDTHLQQDTDTTSPLSVPLPPPKALTTTPNTATSSAEAHVTRKVYNTPSTAVPRRISLSPEQILDRRTSLMLRSGEGTEIDWIVPVDEKVHRPKSLAERLEPTLSNAIAEKTKYAAKARLTGYALNAAIGMQVVLGSMVTALSVVVKGSQVAVMTAVLGGMSTVVASYLARTRGSNEPELSITRVKDLEQFIRECEAFRMDHGHVTESDVLDKELDRLRGRFEELLGNANGERKLSPV